LRIFLKNNFIVRTRHRNALLEAAATARKNRAGDHIQTAIPQGLFPNPVFQSGPNPPIEGGGHGRHVGHVKGLRHRG
ncbi:MAG: hypothetical protein RJA23_1629, partial [Bacteroidota bacterium]